MLLRAGRVILTAAIVLSLSSAALSAQRLPDPATAHSSPVATPFDRYMRPILEQLSAKSRTNRSHPAAAEPVANAASTPILNFGGYLSATSYPARASASAQYDPLNNGVGAVLTADFNKDGRPDLVVMQYDGTLNVLLNTGSGAFSSPIAYLNQGPNIDNISISQAFTADLNGDGYPDLVAYDGNNYQVLTWLNGGDGSFKQPQIFVLDPTLGSPAGIAIGDVNGDGKPDVVGAYSTFLSRTSGTLAVQPFLGKGDGTFTAAAGQTFSFPAIAAQLPGTNPIALGDLNGDGKLDLAIINVGQTSQTTATLSVYTSVGNGNGTFGALSANPVLSADFSGFILLTSGVEILDVNNDGKLDIVADLGTNNVFAALGNGQGTFAPQVSSPFQSSTGTVFADMNGDGFPDAITEGNGDAAIFLGKGDGTFSAPPLDTGYVTDLFNGPGIATADFTGDGKVDLARLSASFYEVEVFTGNGDGSLQGARALSVPDDFVPNDNALVGAVNANGDAYSDVLIENFLNNSPTFYTGLSDGKGGFTYVASLSGGLPSDFAEAETFQADFNGDGKQDMILTGYAGEVWTALSNGDGTFAAPVAINMPTLACPVSNGSAGDLNGDGKADLVIAYPGDAACGGSTVASGYFVIKGNGDGTFQTPAFYPAGVQFYSATLADMNLDGNLDLLLNDEPSSANGTDQITLQLGNGDGTFGVSSTVLSNYVVTDFQAVDINQDGMPDLVLAAQELETSDVSTGGIILIDGNGDGTFGARSQIASGYFFWNIQLADVNGDGIPDIEAALYSYSGQATTYSGFTTLLGTGEGGFGLPYNQPVVPSGGLVLTGNFFDDNALDVVVNTNGGIGLFLNQGGTTISLAASSATINVGQSETLSAAVAATMTGRPAPTGSVAFYDGATLLATAQISAGSASFTANSLAAGAHSFTASYAGDANFNLNASAATGVTVNSLATASITLSASSASINFGQSETLTAVVAASATGLPAPTGSVSFYDGATLLGTTTQMSGGSASFTASSLAVGSHSFTASYSGDANFTPGTSAVATVTVNTLAPAFTLSGTPSTLTLKQGANGTVILSLAANATFSGPITLSCSGAPTNGTCSFGASTVALSPGGTATATLVVGTTGAVSTAHAPASPWQRAAGMVSMAGVVAFSWSRRRRLCYLTSFGVALLAIAALGISGCGGNGRSKTTTPTAPVVSTGSYTITVTASASGSAAPAQTATVKVTVQ